MRFLCFGKKPKPLNQTVEVGPSPVPVLSPPSPSTSSVASKTPRDASESATNEEKPSIPKYVRVDPPKPALRTGGSKTYGYGGFHKPTKYTSTYSSGGGNAGYSGGDGGGGYSGGYSGGDSGCSGGGDGGGGGGGGGGGD